MSRSTFVLFSGAKLRLLVHGDEIDQMSGFLCLGGSASNKGRRVPHEKKQTWDTFTAGILARDVQFVMGTIIVVLECGRITTRVAWNVSGHADPQPCTTSGRYLLQIKITLFIHWGAIFDMSADPWNG